MSSGPALAQGASDELSRAYGGDQSIMLATGYSRPLRAAPVNATIVTREEIERSGANNLLELLQTVSSYYLTSNDGHSTTTIARGVSSRVLVLVDGVPLYQGFVDATLNMQDVLLYNIERVEITRGPGSALYGADAVGGIINLITRTDSARGAQELGAVGGNLRQGGVWGIDRVTLGPGSLSLYGAYADGEYNRSIVQADAQSAFDQIFHTHASLAPGPVNDAHELADSRVEYTVGSWTARVSYRDEFNGGDGAGLAFALDPTGRISSAVGSAELVERRSLSTNWDIAGYLAYIDVRQNANVTGYPPGAFGGAFPDGVKQIFDASESRVRGEAATTYSGWTNQKLLFMLGGFSNDFTVDADVRNYIVRGGAVIPTGLFASYADFASAPLIGPASDIVTYGVVQDEWTLAPDWTFTGGARLDHYSTFGSEWTPRAALVYSPTPQATMKLLYEQAFRPPSAQEFESNGTYDALGNPALRPMVQHMEELDGAYRLGGGVELSAALFKYQITNLIGATPDPAVATGLQYMNAGDDSGQGAELGMQWQPSSAFRASLQYSYQRHDDKLNIDDGQTAPSELLDATLEWTPAPGWSAYVSGLGVAGRGRLPGVAEAHPPDYTLFNVAVSKRWARGLSLRGRVTNLFNREVYDPSEFTTALPYGVPEPGRVWRISIVQDF